MYHLILRALSCSSLNPRKMLCALLTSDPRFNHAAGVQLFREKVGVLVRWAVSLRVNTLEVFNDGYPSKRTADNKDPGRRG